MQNLASRKRDIIVGLVILIVIAGVFLLVKGKPKSMTVPQGSSGPTISQIEQTLRDKYNFNVPDGVEKTDLKDVTGGIGSGIATRTEILADLPDPDQGYFYQAWLSNGDKTVSLGQMSMVKGGWLISYEGANYPSYNKVIVSLERYFDNKIEKLVLEGTFK